MFSSTHRLIAHKVYENIEKELNIKLDYTAFRYGSIAPDIHLSMLVMSHRKEGSFSFLCELIERLSYRSLPNTKRGIKNFSFGLGLVIHFVADYFCKAHNDDRYKNLVLHYIYERKLASFYKRKVRRMRDIKVGAWRFEADADLYINRMVSKYLLDNKSLTNDVMYSLEAANIVALNIVAAACEKSANIDMDAAIARAV